MKGNSCFRLIAPLNPSGVGSHAQHLALGLCYWEVMQQCEFILAPRGKYVPSISKVSTQTLDAKLMTQKDIEPDVTVVLDLPKVCNDLAVSMQVAGKKRVAYTVFELSGPQGSEFKKLFDNFQEVWLPTIWAVEEAISQGYPEGRMRVVPEGTFTAPPRLTDRDPLTDPIRVASVGKFEVRKGQDILLAALLGVPRNFTIEAFWHNPWAPQAAAGFLSRYEHRCRTHPRSVQAELVPYPETRPEVPEWRVGNVTIRLNHFCRFNEDMWKFLRENTDIAIFPHLAEGWGLPILEAIACGIPTIASVSSGPATYLRQYYKAMEEMDVPLQGLTTLENRFAFDPIFYPGVVKENHWSVPDTRELSQRVSALLDCSASRMAQAASTAGARTSEAFSWKRSSEAFLEAVEACCGK